MKTCATYLLALGLLGVMLVVPSSAASPPPASHVNMNGLMATAVFDTFSSDGCVETFVFLQATNGRIRVSGFPSTLSSVASIFISTYDFCTQTQLLAATGFANLTAEAFQINRK